MTQLSDPFLGPVTRDGQLGVSQPLRSSPAPAEVTGAPPGPAPHLRSEPPLPAGLPGATSKKRVVTNVVAVLSSWHRAERRPAPILLDATATGLAVGLATGRAAFAVGAVATVVIGGLLFGLHRRRSPLEAQGTLWAVRPASPIAVTLLAVLLTGVAGTDRGAALGAAVTTALVLIAGRALLWLPIAAARRRGYDLRPTLIVGPGHRVEQLRQRLSTFPEAGLRFATAHAPGPGARGGRLLNALDDTMAEHAALQVLFVADGEPENVLRQIVRFATSKIDCAVVPPIAGMYGGRTGAAIGDLGVVPLYPRRSWGTDAAKRVFDLVGALALIVVGSPLLLLIAAAVRLGDRGPVLFRQRRVGHHGEVFTVLKFRTMVVDAEQQRGSHLEDNVGAGLLFKLRDDPRVTRLGGFLRRSSADELPQLFNVVRGSMSLVGPRPLPVAPEEFEADATVRHLVRPGMTGPWQVHGSNAIAYDDMLDLDSAYVVGHRLGMDLRMLLMTLPALIVRRSAY